MSMPSLIVPIAADHRGFALKSSLIEWMKKQGHTPEDLGTHSEERCDAFDFARAMAIKMASHKVPYGVLICGSGHAMAMTANRYKHIRAAHCSDITTARMAREHNDANVLVLGSDITGAGVIHDCLDVFLNTSFLGGRYAERRDRLTALGGL